MNEDMNIIILTEPTEKFVCCGQSQNVSAEVDLKFCKKNSIGYTRRIAGGTNIKLVEDKLTNWVIKKNKELEKEYQTEKWLNPHRI